MDRITNKNGTKTAFIAAIIAFILSILSLCSFITFLSRDSVFERLNITTDQTERADGIITGHIENKDAQLALEIADTPQEQARGLMDRTNLAQDSGMLFVFEDSQPRSFWMKDTYIALDIAFLDEEGRVLNIEQNARPLDTGPRYRSRGSAKYAIETKAGWFERNSVEEGDLFKFSPAID